MTNPIVVTPNDIEGDYELSIDLSKTQPKLKKDEYQCTACGGIFTYGWSDEEAKKEYKKNFPTYVKRGDPVDIVCDDCYLQLTAWKSPQEAEAELAKLEGTHK